MDRRIHIKFCYKIVIKCNKVLEMLSNASGESTASKTRIYKWDNSFQDACEDIEDEECMGHPSTTIDENVKKMEKMIMKGHRITVREVADDVGISIGSCHKIFHLFWV